MKKLLLVLMLAGCAKVEPVAVSVAAPVARPDPEFTIARRAIVDSEHSLTEIAMQEVVARDGSRCITAAYNGMIAMQCDFARGGK